MGRRAKNKQGDPEPFADANGAAARPSAKKLGKRKAEREDAVSKRPVKKMKEEVQSKEGMEKKGSTKKEVQMQKSKTAARVKAPPKKRKQEESEDEEEDDDLEEGASSAGWEDVEDEYDVQAEAKCAQSSTVYLDFTLTSA